MLKTISAALLAVTVLAAPALAATSKSDEVRTSKGAMNARVLNANAKMGRAHARHYRHTSHGGHNKAAKAKTALKVGFKTTAHATGRG